MNKAPIRRLIAAANCQEPDRVPVVLFGLVPHYSQRWARASGKEVTGDLESTLESMIEYFKRWPEVVPLMNGPNNRMKVGLCIWLRKSKSRTGMSQTPQHSNIESIKKKLKKAQVPDPQNDEQMHKILDDWQGLIDYLPSEVRRRYGGLIWNFELPVGLGCVGRLFSYSQVFRFIYEDPPLLHDLLDFHTRSLITLIQAVEKLFIQADLSLPRFQLAEEILPMLAPHHVREFCVPYTRRIYKTSHSPIRVFHCDNRVTHMADVITSLGANVFFGNFSNYWELKKLFGNKMALMGNVPSVDTFTGGSPADVEACCKWLISKCGPDGGFILSTGGGVDPFGDSPLENIDTMVSAAEKYGQYPLTVSEGDPPPRYQAVMSSHFYRKAAKSRPQKEPHLNSIADQVSQGELLGIETAIKEALEAGIPPKHIYRGGLCLGVNRATDLFYENKYFYPEIERTDSAFQAGFRALGSNFKPEFYKGKVVIGSLSVHDRGTRLIEIMLQGGGLNVTNLGRNLSAKRFIEEAEKKGAQVIAMGVYFFRYLKRAEKVSSMLKERGLPIKTLVGGMGIIPQILQDLEVDAYAANGLEALEKTLSLIDS